MYIVCITSILISSFPSTCSSPICCTRLFKVPWIFRDIYSQGTFAAFYIMGMASSHAPLVEDAIESIELPAVQRPPAAVTWGKGDEREGFEPLTRVISVHIERPKSTRTLTVMIALFVSNCGLIPHDIVSCTLSRSLSSFLLLNFQRFPRQAAKASLKRLTQKPGLTC